VKTKQARKTAESIVIKYRDSLELLHFSKHKNASLWNGRCSGAMRLVSTKEHSNVSKLKIRFGTICFVLDFQIVVVKRPHDLETFTHGWNNRYLAVKKLTK